jgi:hypothetical protein
MKMVAVYAAKAAEFDTLAGRAVEAFYVAVAKPVFIPIKVPFEPSSDRQERKGEFILAISLQPSAALSRVDESVSCSTQTSRTHPRSQRSAEKVQKAWSGLNAPASQASTQLHIRLHAPRDQRRCIDRE